MSRPKQGTKTWKVPTGPGLAGRFLAFAALQDHSIKELPTDRIRTLAGRYEIPARERSFAYELLAGSIKRRGTIDHLIERIGGRRARKIPSDLLTLLRLGIYQLVFEDGIPEFAAVDTLCELAKNYVGRPQVGFLNAILRKIQRSIEARNVTITSENEAAVIPTVLDRGVRFKTAVLPEPGSVDFLAAAYSYPKWLIARWLARWDASTLRGILSAGNARPTMVCRPNGIKLPGPGAAEELARILTAQSCRVTVLAEEQMVALIDGPPITELNAFHEGLFQIQDSTTAEPAKQLSPGPGMAILDTCAGLGTKTTQLAELAGDQAVVFASDRAEEKLVKVRENAERLGLRSIRTIPLEAASERRYDAVLLDVPCTNTGVLDRRPEVRWRIRETDFARYAAESGRMLDQARELVETRGKILFSTCSIDDEENGRGVRAFCDRAAWRIVAERLQLPEVDRSTGKTIRSGGYWAVLERSP